MPIKRLFVCGELFSPWISRGVTEGGGRFDVVGYFDCFVQAERVLGLIYLRRRSVGGTLCILLYTLVLAGRVLDISAVVIAQAPGPLGILMYVRHRYWRRVGGGC